MSITLFALVTAAAPTVLRAAGDFLRENKGLVKGATPVIREASKKVDQKIDEIKNAHENDGWEKE